MNRHGETYEERPPAGEYWLCPLEGCAFKLLFALPMDTTAVHDRRTDPLWALGEISTWIGGSTPDLLTEMVASGMRAHAEEREHRMLLHFKSHQLVDYYRTCEAIMTEANIKAAKIRQLVEYVRPTGETEQGKAGG